MSTSFKKSSMFHSEKWAIVSVSEMGPCFIHRNEAMFHSEKWGHVSFTKWGQHFIHRYGDMFHYEKRGHISFPMEHMIIMELNVIINVDF